MEVTDEDGNQKGVRKWKCEKNVDDPQKRSRFSRKPDNLVVIDAKRSIPTNVNAINEVIIWKLAGEITEDENFAVDKDDFLTMKKAMDQWRPLHRRGKHFANRLITACDAVREFLTTDEKLGSYKIVRLDLSPFLDVRFVPPIIGELTHLQELNLSQTKISEIPTNIFLRCKHLKILDLSSTTRLQTIPGEIGNLSELRELYLGSSKILYLPSYSILGRLKKLEILDLSGIRIQNLDDIHVETELQEGVQPKLTSLRILNLRYSTFLKGTPSRPPWWKKNSFQSFFLSDRLCDINLCGADDLTSLSDVVGDLTMLERLDLSFSDIASLPPTASSCYDRLVHLKVLNLKSTPVLRKYPQLWRDATLAKTNTEVEATNTLPLHDLVLGKRCPLLGCIGMRPYQTDNFPPLYRFRSVLARNRARTRISTMLRKKGLKGDGGSYSSDFSRTLWPVLLAKAIDLHGPYDECEDDGCDCQRPTKERDALFGLLVTFGNDILGCNEVPGKKQ